jgi:hypothetical protein
MKKRIKILFAFCFVLSALSVHAQMGAAYYDAVMKPKFGVLVANAGATVNDKAIIARDSLKSQWVRSRILMDGWSGSSAAYDDYASAGLNQLVVLVTFATGTPQPWITDPTDLLAYAANVGSVCRKYPKEKEFVADNEAITTTYPDDNVNAFHSGSLSQYLNQCAAIKDTLHKYGVQMIESGIYGVGLHMYTYRWLKTKYNQTVADDFGSRCMSGTQISAANTVNSNPTLEFYYKQIDTILTSGLFDEYNIHPYHPFGTSTQKDTITISDFTVWRFIKECVEDVTKKICIINETGIRGNESAAYLTSYLNVCMRLGFKYVQHWSGTNVANDTKSLTADDGTLNDAGNAFKAFVPTHN